MALSKDKCEFNMKEVKFMGQEIVRVDLDKELAERDMPVPTDRKSLKLDSHCADSYRPMKSRYCRGIHCQARYIHIVAMLSASRIMN